MKATELMLGDWIKDYTYGAVRVSSLEGRSIGIKVGDKEYSAIHPQQANPIPLTAEILEKNGFEYGISDARRNFAKIAAYGTIIKDEKWHTRFDELVLEKRTEKDEDGEYIIWDIENFVGITDVHELQHALRLCGLNELADNFKID